MKTVLIIVSKKSSKKLKQEQLLSCVKIYDYKSLELV